MEKSSRNFLLLCFVLLIVIVLYNLVPAFSISYLVLSLFAICGLFVFFVQKAHFDESHRLITLLAEKHKLRLMDDRYVTLLHKKLMAEGKINKVEVIIRNGIFSKAGRVNESGLSSRFLTLTFETGAGKEFYLVPSSNGLQIRKDITMREGVADEARLLKKLSSLDFKGYSHWTLHFFETQTSLSTSSQDIDEIEKLISLMFKAVRLLKKQ